MQPRGELRGIAQGGFQRSALKSLLRGEARSLRRGGNRPRPGFPLGEMEAVDDFRVTNPPSHPDLLDAMAQDLASHRFDLRHLMRAILNSRTYQLSAEPNEANRHDSMNYSHYTMRRLSVETMVDAITQVTGVPEKFHGYPVGTHAMQVDQTYAFAPNYVFKTFGRPARDIICERDHQPDITQTLHLISGETINKKIASPKSTLEKWLQDPNFSNEKILYKIFRRALVPGAV